MEANNDSYEFITTDALVSASLAPQPYSIVFCGNSTKPVFTISFAGKTVKLSDGFEWDDAAKTFWDCVLKYAPPGFKIEKDA